MRIEYPPGSGDTVDYDAAEVDLMRDLCRLERDGEIDDETLRNDLALVHGFKRRFDARLLPDRVDEEEDDEYGLEPTCRYPSHRGADWTATGGRRVCGVCHPPAAGLPSGA